eukprot:TRINITY_DN240_c1_g2_i1.p2 TRINITY_DN240_c1_g2~~TRINITY_DN240_c1_g2_i1.p2  ORF type:complete len:101 (-),score=15.98 TRINITY_DN240_c1_g2_i1:118-420(-)
MRHSWTCFTQQKMKCAAIGMSRLSLSTYDQSPQRRCNVVHVLRAHFFPPLALLFSFPRAFFMRFFVSFLPRRPAPAFFSSKPARFKRYFGSYFFILSRLS